MSTLAEARPATADLVAVKRRQQATWASGDYAVVGTTLQIVGETLAESIDVRAGEHVLDVAAGNGNATLAAARRFANVISTDYVPALLDKGRTRARAEGLPVHFEEADVENLPFADGTFDIVLSTFGVMFAPDHEKSAAEMMRVLRKGGRLGLTNWTPEGFIGRLFKLVGAYVPPPAGVKSPTLWGSDAHIERLFGAQAVQIETTRRIFNFRYASPAHWLQVFRDFYGPTHKAFLSLDAAAAAALERDILQLLTQMNVAGESALVVPSEYLEIVVTKS